MQGKLIATITGVVAVIIALILNPFKLPQEELSKMLPAKVVFKTDTVRVAYRVNVPYQVISTKTIERIREIKVSVDSLYAAELVSDCDSLKNQIAVYRFSVSKKIADMSTAAEQLQAEKQALIDDRNQIVDALADATNELWKTKADTVLIKKKFKHGIGASYMILGGSQPIYKLTYEKPITPSLSVEAGPMWNGSAGASVGVKIRF